MRIVQLNLNHCETAQDLLSQYVRENKTDVAIICEQYRDLDESTWEADDTGRAAIWACGNVALQEKMRTGANILSVSWIDSCTMLREESQ